MSRNWWRAMAPLMAVVAACADVPTEPGEYLAEAPGLARVRLGAIDQIVTVSPSVVRPGQEIVVETVLTAWGDRPHHVECRYTPDVEGDILVPRDGSAAGTTERGLWEGAIVRSATTRTIRPDAPPGEHVLRVRYLLKPELWVRVAVLVEPTEHASSRRH